MGAKIAKLPLTFRLAALMMGALLLVYLGMAALYMGRADWYPKRSDEVLLLINGIAVLALAYAAVNSRGQGRRVVWAWGLMAAAQVLYLAGDAILNALQASLGEQPFPSLADAFYLAYYPVFAIGLFLLPAAQLSRDERQRISLDITIVMLSAGLLLLNFLIMPIAQDIESTRWEIIVGVAYPAFDLVLFFVLSTIMFRQQALTSPTLLFLEGGVAAYIVGDILYARASIAGTYFSGSPIDLVFALAYTLIALAGVIQGSQLEENASQSFSLSLAGQPQRRFGWVVYTPYIWGLLAYLVLAFHESVSPLSEPVLTTFVGGIIVLILVRQVLSLQENASLYHSEAKRRRVAEALADASREMTTTLDFQTVPGLILEQLATVVPYERCSVMLEKDNHLFIAAERGFPKNDQRTQHVQIAIRDDDQYLKLEETFQPLIIDDVTQVQGWTILPWLPLNKAWMGVPLIVRDKVIGMISMTRKEAGAFGADDKVPAMAFAGQAAVALENSQLYGELDRAYRTLEVLDKTKSNFIEIVAHELRTPLTVIKGYAQSLEIRPQIKEDDQNTLILIGILRGVERMQEVVNTMLDVIKIDNQVLKLRKESFALDDLFRRVVAAYEKALQERNLILKVEDLSDLPLIQADHDLIYKVFMQLVMNAIKYTPDGGRITIRGRLDRATNTLEIVVADTGIGIASDQLEVIFEKFYQTGQVSLHSSGQTKFRGGGPGLGLPLARGIVVAHGGKIWAESSGYDEEKCPGSQFYVCLPVQ